MKTHDERMVSLDTWVIPICVILGFLGAFTIGGGWVTPLRECKNLVLGSAVVSVLAGLIAMLTVHGRLAFVAFCNAFSSSALAASLLFWKIAKSGGRFSTSVDAAMLSVITLFLACVFGLIVISSIVLWHRKRELIQTRFLIKTLGLQALVVFCATLMPILIH